MMHPMSVVVCVLWGAGLLPVASTGQLSFSFPSSHFLIYLFCHSLTHKTFFRPLLDDRLKRGTQEDGHEKAAFVLASLLVRSVFCHQLHMWSHQARAVTWVYLKIWTFSNFFTVYILNKIIPAENDFGISCFPLCCPKYKF